MEELPFPDNMDNTKELGFLDKNGNTVELHIGSGGGSWYEDEGILEWWVVGDWKNDKLLQPHQESEVKRFLNEYLKYHGVPEYEIIWRNYGLERRGDEQESHCFITLNPLPADEEKLWKSLWEGNKTKCKHEDLSIKTMEVLNGELLLTLDCDKCGKRTSTSASLNQGWEAEDLNTWAKQELSSHGQNVSFKNWAKKEVKSHGNIDLVDWAKHEKQSHTKKYGAEYENIGTMSVAPARGYKGYMNMMSSARRMVEIGNETGLDQKLGEAYQDESGRWFLPILERKDSESFSLDSKKADSITMEEPVIEEPSFIPDGDGRAIGQQNSSINLSPLHAETFNANAKSGDKVYVITRRCEDYSAYRELDVAVFGSKTEAKKKFNILFKEAKEQEYPDETIADAKSYMRWGDVGWGIESFMASDMIYELNEHIVGSKGGFYFDAETFGAEIGGEVGLEQLESPEVKSIMKKHGIKIVNREMIERVAWGRTNDDDIDLITFSGPRKGLEQLADVIFDGDLKDTIKRAESFGADYSFTGKIKKYGFELSDGGKEYVITYGGRRIPSFRLPKDIYFHGVYTIERFVEELNQNQERAVSDVFNFLWNKTNNGHLDDILMNRAETFEAFDINEDDEGKTIIENKCDGCGKQFNLTTNPNIIGGERAGAIVYEWISDDEHYIPTYSPYGDLYCKTCYKEEAEEDDFQRYNRGQGQIDSISEMNAEEHFDCGCVYEEMADGAMCESCGHTTCIDCSQNINTTDANYKNWRCYEGYGCNKKKAEGDAATYSPSSNPDMVNEIQTSPTNESPQLFNASNTFNTTTALGIGGLVVAALSLPMLYSSAKSRLGKSAEEKRKASGSVRKNHTQIKNSEYSVGQVNPVEAEGQQDIHGAEGITNPRHIPSPTPSGYPSKTLKMW